MAFTFGFYDSVNGDRTYTAKQFSQFFDGILSEGVFEKIGDEFNVTAASGMLVNVGIGRAWLKKKWALNDSVLPVAIAAAEPILNRVDTVIFAIDETSRTIEITTVKGTPASAPTAPALTNTAEHFEYRIADVYIPATSTSISNDNISNFVGTEALPYVRLELDTLFYSDATPLVDGTASPGTLRTMARGDHRHPTDTSRAAVNSPTFTGDPKAPTPSDGDNDTSIATTAFVMREANKKVNSASGAFTGTPTAPTAAAGTNTTQIATTAFVKNAVDTLGTTVNTKAPTASPTFTGDPKAPTPADNDNDTSIATTAYVMREANKKQVKKVTTTATLTVAGWSSSQQTITVSGVTSSNLVEVSPAPASWEVASVAGIYCSAQGSNSLTFKCNSVPTAAITINVVIWN